MNMYHAMIHASLIDFLKRYCGIRQNRCDDVHDGWTRWELEVTVNQHVEVATIFMKSFGETIGKMVGFLVWLKHVG